MKRKLQVLSLLALPIFGAGCEKAADLAVSKAYADNGEIEVDQLIKCEDGGSVGELATQLNFVLRANEVHASGTPNGIDGPHQTLVIKKPFKTSAPAIGKADTGATRMCVTLSKE